MTSTARLWDLPAITLEPDPVKQVTMACEQLWKSGAPLNFTREELTQYPVLEGEPIDPVHRRFRLAL